MIELNELNYFSPEAMRDYWSVSQFKSFEKCEAMAMAELNGEYEREMTTSLLIGSYVDAYFSDTGTMAGFIDEHPEVFNSRTGQLKAEYRRADDIITRIDSDPLMTKFLRGQKQVIMTAEIFDVPW